MMAGDNNPLKQGLKWATPFALVLGVADMALGRYLMGGVDLLTVAGLCLAYWLSGRASGQVVAAHLIVFLAAFIFLGATLEGGLAGVGFIWTVGFPIIACFIAGARPGLTWSVAYIPVIALALYLTRSSEPLMHYRLDALLYGVAAYAMFTGFAYFMAASREHREAQLRRAELQARNEARALSRSEERFRTLLDCLPDAVVVNLDRQLVYANPAAATLFSAEHERALMGTAMLDFVHPDDREMVMQRQAKVLDENDAPALLEEKMLRTTGEVFAAEVQSRGIVFGGRKAVLVMIRDISQRKQLEAEQEQMQQQLSHSQRLDSLGVLAGGIAHDFNNLLSAIVGNVEFAGKQLPEGSGAAEYLSRVDEACNEASMLCRQMLAYAGKGEFTIRVIRLYDALHNMGKLLRASLGKKVRLHIKLAKGLPSILADYAQFQQVMLNLIVNASDAIGDREGDITVKAHAVEMDAETLVAFAHGRPLRPGSYVSISVRDTGCGMDQSVMNRMFDPFYTTKATGNGLGLSAILGTVQRHGGGVAVFSRAGLGTTFELLFPQAPEHVQDKPETAPVLAAVEEVQLTGTVLLADDEKSIRLLVGDMLEQLGLNVLCAEDGVSALALYRQHADELVAVLMDMNMPRLSGVEAMRRMRVINSDVPVLLVSGYNEQEINGLRDDERPSAFVHKPFRMADLQQVLGKVIALNDREERP